MTRRAKQIAQAEQNNSATRSPVATREDNARRLDALRRKRAIPLIEAAKLLDSWGPCESCGTEVVYLKVDGQLKAFGAVSQGLAFSHACGDPPDSSLRAWSGGAVEQSRRRH